MKHHVQRAFLLAAAALLCGAGLVHAGQVKLTLLASISGNQAAGAEALAKAYMAKNPGVIIEVEARPGGSEGDNLVKTRLATDEMSDLFIYNTGSLLQALKPEATLADLTDLPCMAGIDKEFLKTVAEGDSFYGVPFGTTMVGGIFYNKRIYRELGLSVPTTWAEFMDNCRKVKESGKAAPVAQTYRNPWTAQLPILADYYNLQHEVPDFAERYTANQAKFADTPAARKGFERLRDLHDAGLMNADYGAATFPDGVYMLATGEAAHYPMLSHALAAWMQDYPEYLDDIGCFAQPSDTADVNGLTVWMPSAAYIPKTTKHLEEAKKFADYIGSVEGTEVFMADSSAQGPSVVEGAELPADTPAAVRDMLPYFAEGRYASALEFVSPIKGPALQQICVEVGSGMRDPESAAAMYDEDVRKQARQLGLPNW